MLAEVKNNKIIQEIVPAFRFLVLGTFIMGLINFLSRHNIN